MRHLLIGVSLGLALVLQGAARPAASTQAPAAAPRLIVLIMVDQMRGQYLEDYRPLFTHGFDRLLKEGAWFRRGAYPYLNTVTCVGHATVGTGTFPHRHGMVLNAWYDRERGAPLPGCTDDPAVEGYALGRDLAPVPGQSAKRLMQPTLGERLRSSHKGRVVSLSLKARSTIGMAGQSADAAAWFDDRGAWVSSLAYGRAPEALQAFIEANPPAADAPKVWERTLAPDSYRFTDDAPEEHAPAGWDVTFPHPLSTGEGAADAAFYLRWQRSPYADEYLGRMAGALVDRMQLGRGSGVDMLAVSFSTLDLVGHAFGPRSHEVQDVLVRLDATLGKLLGHLDATLGRDGYVVGLSADHGVSEIPEQTTDGGRLAAAAVKGALQAVLEKALGPGDHVAATMYTDLYLAPAAAERAGRDPALRTALLDALRALPGVQAAFYGPNLADAAARGASDPARRAAALNYYPGRSGDLILVPRANWITSTAAATHGSQHEYDQRVPVLLFGAGVKAGTYDEPATPADLMPSLAAAVGVPAGDVDGRVLTEALVPARK